MFVIDIIVILKDIISEIEVFNCSNNLIQLHYQLLFSSKYILMNVHRYFNALVLIIFFNFMSEKCS